MKMDAIRLMPIKNGTVIDHLPVGSAFKIIEILELEKSANPVTIAINTESKRLGRKDLVFIEAKELKKEEIEKIGLIAKGATLNYIKDSEVKQKIKIALPEKAIGIMQCINPKCITNIESIQTKFELKKNPLKAKCYYCEKTMNEKEIANAIK